MKIRYQPRHGFREIELRDIKGGNSLAKWTYGQEQEVPAGLTVPFQSGGESPVQMDAATAVFRHGPDFVDAATGKNPLYTCADCGEPALEEHWWDRETLDPIYFVNDRGARLDIACWLSYHPERFAEFRERDKSTVSAIERAQQIIAKRSSGSGRSAVSAPPAQED